MKILNQQKPRTRKQKKQLYIKLLFLFLMTSFVIFTATLAYEFLVSSKIFKLKNVIVSGNNLLPSVLIIKKADLPLGKNLFKINTDVPKEELLDFRLIEKVSFRKSFPNTMVISIQERVPIALLLFNQKLFYIDKEGKLISGVNSKFFKKMDNKLNYPTITGIEENFDLSEKEKFTEKALFLLSVFKEDPFLKDILISEVNINRDKGVSIIMAKNSIPVLFGFDDFQRKATFLYQTLKDLKSKEIKINEINLDFNKKVVVKQER